MSRDDGLWLFVICTMLRLNILLADGILMKRGWITFSEFGRRNSWFAIGAILIEVSAIVGLAFHFWAKE